MGRRDWGWGSFPLPLLLRQFYTRFPEVFRKKGQSNFLRLPAFCICPQSSFQNRLIVFLSPCFICEAIKLRQPCNSFATITSPGEVALSCLQGQGCGSLQEPVSPVHRTPPPSQAADTSGKLLGLEPRGWVSGPGRDGDAVTLCSPSEQRGGLRTPLRPCPGQGSAGIVGAVLI